MRRHRLVEEAQKLEPFLMSMPFLTNPVNLAVGRVESGKQSRGTVAFVVMRQGLTATRLERQSGLGAIQGLDLAFLIPTVRARAGSEPRQCPPALRRFPDRC